MYWDYQGARDSDRKSLVTLQRTQETMCTRNERLPSVFVLPGTRSIGYVYTLINYVNFYKLLNLDIEKHLIQIEAINFSIKWPVFCHDTSYRILQNVRQETKNRFATCREVWGCSVKNHFFKNWNTDINPGFTKSYTCFTKLLPLKMAAASKENNIVIVNRHLHKSAAIFLVYMIKIARIPPAFAYKVISLRKWPSS